MDLNQHVKLVIDLTICPIHGKKPLIEIADNYVTFECCCIDFKIACFQKLIKILEADKAYLLKFGKPEKYKGFEPKC
jgi:hypothetical protein